jgi:predicted metalloprotease with PDZ domain
MWTRRFPLSAAVLFLLISAAGTPSLATCSYCNCRSFNDYLPDGNGGGCRDSSCLIWCAAPVEASTTWNPQLTGIEVSNDAQPVIIAVYPNSPAERQGIRVGDMLLAVNGKAVPYSCPSDSGLQVYLIRRGTREMEIAVRPISPAEMILNTSFRNVDVGREGLASLPPYISGVILRKTKGGTLIRGVIPGTPADAAGFEKGWRVLAVLDASTNQPSTAGEGAEYRATLKFVLASGGVTTTKTLTLRGLSEILTEIAAPREPAPFAVALRQRQ